MSDEYRSSDDEDYNPEGENEEEEDEEVIPEIDEEEEVEKLVKESKKEETTKPANKPDDIDALFAELTGEDPILAEQKRRKELEALKPSTSTLKFDPEKYKCEEKEKTIEEQPETQTTSKKRVGLLDAAQTLSKKSKLSVLSKSEKDWKEFTETTKISEDLSSHNRGKGGYLNRMDFLNRTDNRQFENEKELRATARKDK